MGSMAEDIAGKVILVTGAARRIGRSIAISAAKRGAQVLIHYHASEEDARQTSAQCDNAPLFRADLTSVPEIRRMFAEIEQLVGRLDGLVNNAARFTRIDALEISEDDWDFIQDVNLKAVFFCCQEAARRMKARGEGRIVNISSLGGLRPWPEHVHYCASKAGVIHMTKALARALAPEISVNSVAPGVIPFEEAGDERIRRFVGHTPAGRAGTGDDIAEAVLWFLTASRFVTGQIIAIDGGLSLK
jgi:3-oxoacyl-[acyl-carrier protein] reductase/pteridine reductase